MNKIGKYLFMLFIVLLISMGGVYASDNNQSSGDVKCVALDDADDLTTVDTADVNEDKVVDVEKESPTVDKNLTKDIVETDSDVSQKQPGKLGNPASSEAVTASGDGDVLADATGGGGNFKSLNSLISSNTGTLTLTGGYTAVAGDYTGTGAVRTQGIDIQKDLTIKGTGSGITLDIAQRGCIFRIDGAYNVVFENLIFTDRTD